jgi:hypothetical protein
VWRDLHFLVLTPLPTTARRRRSPRTVPHEAMHQLATSAGGRVAWNGSSFWARLQGGIQAVGNEAVRGGLRECSEALLAEHSDAVLDIGPWHGDWTPWNMSWEHRGLALWDWERFDPAVPRGFDALHHRLALTTARGLSEEALADLHRRAPGLLRPHGVHGSQAVLVTALYLLELAVRYSLAAQQPGGEPLRARASWTVAALASATSPLRGKPHRHPVADRSSDAST